MTDLVKAKIIELVPEIADRFFLSNDGMTYEDERITLADVLRAMYEVWKEDGHMSWRNEVAELTFPDYNRWNLATDYDGQTQEVKDFIGRLICS